MRVNLIVNLEALHSLTVVNSICILNLLGTTRLFYLRLPSRIATNHLSLGSSLSVQLLACFSSSC